AGVEGRWLGRRAVRAIARGRVSRSASSRESRTGSCCRKPDSLSAGGAAGPGAAGAAVLVLGFFFVPACPASWNGVTAVRLTFFAHTVAAIDTDPATRPNCASIAAWLDGMRPCDHLVALRGPISKVSAPWAPNSATWLTEWNAPQT